MTPPVPVDTLIKSSAKALKDRTNINEVIACATKLDLEESEVLWARRFQQTKNRNRGALFAEADVELSVFNQPTESTDWISSG